MVDNDYFRDRISRRNIVRSIGSLSVLSLGSTGAVAAKADESGSAENTAEKVAEGEDFVTYKIMTENDNKYTKVYTGGDNEGQVKVMDNLASADEITVQDSQPWDDVIEDYDAFIVEIPAGLYGGLSIDLTSTAEYFNEATLASAISGIGAYIGSTVELTPLGSFLLASGTVLAAAIIQYAFGGECTIGIRDSVTGGITYHFKTIDPGYNRTIKGTIPLEEPQPGNWVAGYE